MSTNAEIVLGIVLLLVIALLVVFIGSIIGIMAATEDHSVLISRESGREGKNPPRVPLGKDDIIEEEDEL